jgi:hypothetical protein
MSSIGLERSQFFQELHRVKRSAGRLTIKMSPGIALLALGELDPLARKTKPSRSEGFGAGVARSRGPSVSGCWSAEDVTEPLWSTVQRLPLGPAARVRIARSSG